MPNTPEFAAGYAAALSDWKKEMHSDVDASELTVGEGIAFRSGFLAGWQKAKQQALNLMDPAHEGIIDSCCEVSVGVVTELVQDMKPDMEKPE